MGTANFQQGYGRRIRHGLRGLASCQRFVDQIAATGIYGLDVAEAYGPHALRIAENLEPNLKLSLKANEDEFIERKESRFSARPVFEFLERFKIKPIEYLLLHDELALLSPHGKEIWKTLICAQQEGLVRKLGVSFYSTDALAKTLSLYPLEVVQVPCNPFNEDFDVFFLENQVFTEHIEIHARSLFLQGLLAFPTKLDQPGSVTKFYPYLSQWQNFLQKTGLSPIEALAIFSNQQNWVSKWVLGFDSVDQYRQFVSVDPKMVSGNVPYIGRVPLSIKDPRFW